MPTLPHMGSLLVRTDFTDDDAWDLWGVENNLSISNMDWEEFASEVGGDGVFRGFELPPPASEGEGGG